MNTQDLLKLIEQRTSCRNYLEKEVPAELIKNCIEAARWAPSACNKQPWRFIVVTDHKSRQIISQNGLLPGIPMPWLQKAPVIVVLCAEKSMFAHRIAPLISGVNYQLIDIGIAGEHFVLTAEAQGLGTCWIGWFKEKPIKKLLSIPRSVKVLSLLSLGFPAEKRDPGKRLPYESVCFSETWTDSEKTT